MSTANTFGWQQVRARGGCSAKLSGGALAALLGSLKGSAREFEDASDLVQSGDDHLLGSIDFALPAHPDPYIAGEIAALNALSDLYATGATPCASLAICSVDTALPIEFAQRLLAGLTTTARAEGAAVVGGHTMTGPEYLAGLAVVGRVGEHRVRDHANVESRRVRRRSRRLRAGVHRRHRLRPSRASRGEARTAVRRVHRHRGGSDSFRGPQPPRARARKREHRREHGVRSLARRRATHLAESRLLPLYDAQTNGGLLVAAPPASRAFLEAQGFEHIGMIINEHIIEIHGRD